MFTARNVKYRCLIPECENTSDTTYNPEWLEHFVPYQHNFPSSCSRYTLTNNQTCLSQEILSNETIQCNEFIFQREESAIVHDFSIFCGENLWKLTMIGTLSVAGEIVCLSYAGFISDRYGRPKLIMMGVMLSTMIGLSKSFSGNYIVYAALEFLDTALCAATYSASFVQAMELVRPNQRDRTNLIICCLYSTGQCIIGITAWLSYSWRMMLRILYTPGVLFILFVFSIPESRAWFLGYNKNQQQTEGFGAKLKQGLLGNPAGMQTRTKPTKHMEFPRFRHAVVNKVLLLRMIHCSFTWLGSYFVYYGLTLQSLTISEDIYINFISCVLFDIPGFWIYYYGSKKFRRRRTMMIAFAFTGVCCLCVGFIREELYWMKLIIFLLGKCGSAMVFALTYVFTAELFPRTSRHAMMAICAMFGKIGLLLAPQLPLLARVNKSVPLMIFGILSLIAGVLALFFPETLNTKLPETIEDAVNIGKTSVGRFG
nr:solute carrier family 22 member 3-like [Leptinotarsa decemlineata]